MELPRGIEKRIKELLTQDEQVLKIVSAVSEKYKDKISFGKTLFLVLTHKRLIFLDKGTFNIDEKSILLEKIDSISKKSKFLSSDIYVYTGNTRSVATSVEKNEADIFIKMVNEELQNYKSFSIQLNKTVEQEITDKIEKLAELYKEGILTEYEFATKRMELLEKLK